MNTTRIIIKDEKNRHLVSLTFHSINYPAKIEEELVALLKEIRITDGIAHQKMAPSMGALAAQVIQYFKNHMNGLALVPQEIDNDADFQVDFEIAYAGDEKVSLDMYGFGTHRELPLYKVEYSGKVYEFVYDKQDGSSAKWRKINVVEENDVYFTGYDMKDEGKFKRFNLDKVIGGSEKISVYFLRP